MIKLENISKRFVVGNKEFLALDNVSLHLKAGFIYGFVGESGAGKTSLLRCINLLERPEGRVTVCGHDLTTLSEKELRGTRRRIGMIFQHFNLLNTATVYDNIALPLTFIGVSKTFIEEAVHPLIKLTGLVGKENNYPHQLSGGQKQRVAIARALVTKPDVLLADEPTSALDKKTTASIVSLLKEINQTTGLTMVIVSHELDVVEALCHRVIEIDQGKVVNNLSSREFFADEVNHVA